MAGFAIPFFEFVNTTRRYFGGDVGAREGRELTELPETTTRTAFGAEPGVTFSVGEDTCCSRRPIRSRGSQFGWTA